MKFLCTFAHLFNVWLTEDRRIYLLQHPTYCNVTLNKVHEKNLASHRYTIGKEDIVSPLKGSERPSQFLKPHFEDHCPREPAFRSHQNWFSHISFCINGIKTYRSGTENYFVRVLIIKCSQHKLTALMRNCTIKRRDVFK